MQGEWYEVEREADNYGGWSTVGRRFASGYRDRTFMSLSSARRWVTKRRNDGWEPLRIIRVSSRGREVVDG